MPARTVSTEERRARLARRHRLVEAERVDDVAAIADSLLLLHSTDPVTVYLSAMLRMRHPSVATVEQALYDDRSVVRHHAMRRTLWVGTPDVVRLAHVAATRKVAGREHRLTAGLLAESGVEDPEAWLADAREQVRAALREHGPLSARTLGVKVPALRQPIVLSPGRPWSQTVSAHTRVLLGLGFEGEIMRTRPTGTWVNGAYTYAVAEDWLDGGLASGPGAWSEREAAAELALRWLRVFGPGTSTDLQWWMGWTKALTRDALADCGAVEVVLDEGPGWLAPDDLEEEEPVEPWVALLPSLDPTTMGWKERAWYLPENAAGAFDRNGNGGPTIWADGQVVGAWAQDAGGEVRTHYFSPPSRRVSRAVDRRARELVAMLGDARTTVRFPSPVSTALAKGEDPGR